MDYKEAPSCCKKPMELKAIIGEGYEDMYNYLCFQCEKCGKYMVEEA